jgi:SRSO17 transposase
MTVSVTEIPQVVRQFLPGFQGVFSKPQLQHFAEYVTGLIVNPNKTVTGINDAFLAHRDASTKNHFLTAAPWSTDALADARKRLLVDALTHESPRQGYLIIDDTIAHKTGKTIDGVAWHYDHTTGKSVLGHQVVSSHYVGPHLHLPVDFAPYLPQAALPAGAPVVDKIALAKTLIERAMTQGIPFDTVLLDSWYCCRELTETIAGAEKHWVAACKSNRLLETPHGFVSLATYAQTLPAEAFRQVTLDGTAGPRTFTVFTKTVTLKTLGRVRLVISYEDPSRISEPVFWVTDRKDWDAKRLLIAYLHRSVIEGFYRDAKQHLGFEACELRTWQGVTRHWQCVFVAYTCLTLGAYDRRLVRWLQTRVTTLGSRCRLAMSEVLRSFVLSICQHRPSVENINRLLGEVLKPRSQLAIEFA